MHISRKSLNVLLLAVLLACSAAVLYLIGSWNLVQVFRDPYYLRDVLQSYGAFAAVVLIGLLILNNIVWVIPGHGLGVASGLIYGGIGGIMVCMIGTTISTLLAVLISKRYGRPLVQRIVGADRLEQYDELTASTDVAPFVLLVLVPVVPDDAVAYLAGLSPLRTRRVILAVTAARFPGVVTLVYFGDGIATSNYPLLAGIATVIIVTSAVSVWKKDAILNTVRGTRTASRVVAE